MPRVRTSSIVRSTLYSRDYKHGLSTGSTLLVAHRVAARDAQETENTRQSDVPDSGVLVADTCRSDRPHRKHSIPTLSRLHWTYWTCHERYAAVVVVGDDGEVTVAAVGGDDVPVAVVDDANAAAVDVDSVVDAAADGVGG